MATNTDPQLGPHSHGLLRNCACLPGCLVWSGGCGLGRLPRDLQRAHLGKPGPTAAGGWNLAHCRPSRSRGIGGKGEPCLPLKSESFY